MDVLRVEHTGKASSNLVCTAPSPILRPAFSLFAFRCPLLTPRPILLWCLACLCGLLAGCASAGLLKLGKHDFPKAGPTNPVVQVMALWQPAEGMGLNNTMGRGFAGQVYFITQQEAIPAQVDGAVRIYVFDDQGEVEDQVKPFHQFDYPADAWQAHMQVGKLGPTYSVFVPYTRKGRRQAHCSLRLRFTPKNGPTTYSEMVDVELPGTPNRKARKHDDADNADSAGDSQEPIADPAAPAAVQGKPAGKAAPLARKSPQAAVEDIVNSSPALPSNPAPEAAASAANRQPAPVPLTAEETERIVRETMAKLQSGRGAPAIEQPRMNLRNPPTRQHHVVQASYEDAADEEQEADQDPAPPPRRRNPLEDTDEEDN